MGKVIVHGGGDRVVVRDTSESQSEPDETNAAIREEYRKLDKKKIHDEGNKKSESEKKKKLVLPILLAAGLLIAGICAALYLILN